MIRQAHFCRYSTKMSEIENILPLLLIYKHELDNYMLTIYIFKQSFSSYDLTKNVHAFVQPRNIYFRKTSTVYFRKK